MIEYNISDIPDYLQEATEDVFDELTRVGEAAVEHNKKFGNYQDRTGNLRASNFYEVDDEGLTIGNSAEYASYVESNGFNVVNEGVLLAHRTLNGQ